MGRNLSRYFSLSYIYFNATSEVGAVAAKAEDRKSSEYCHLDFSHVFVLLVIETTGVTGARSSACNTANY